MSASVPGMLLVVDWLAHDEVRQVVKCKRGEEHPLWIGRKMA